MAKKQQPSGADRRDAFLRKVVEIRRKQPNGRPKKGK
jgi:hypothetical protein